MHTGSDERLAAGRELAAKLGLLKTNTEHSIRIVPNELGLWSGLDGLRLGHSLET